MNSVWSSIANTVASMKNFLSSSIFEFYRKMLVIHLNLGRKWDNSLFAFILLILRDEKSYIRKLQRMARNNHDVSTLIVIVGVHHGETTIQYLEKIPNSIVIGFEPNEDSFEVAKLNLQRFGNRVKLLNKAVGKYQGTGRLNLFSDSGMDSLLPSVKTEAQYVHAIEITTLDFELRNYQRVDLLQIDCQGY